MSMLAALPANAIPTRFVGGATQPGWIANKHQTL
jgi:hypothetical protein